MTSREQMLAALNAGKKLTAIKASALTAAGEDSCRQTLSNLHIAGIVQRRPYRSSRAGYPAWEYFIADAKPACCPHCGGEL